MCYKEVSWLDPGRWSSSLSPKSSEGEEGGVPKLPEFLQQWYLYQLYKKYKYSSVTNSTRSFVDKYHDRWVVARISMRKNIDELEMKSRWGIL